SSQRQSRGGTPLGCGNIYLGTRYGRERGRHAKWNALEWIGSIGVQCCREMVVAVRTGRPCERFVSVDRSAIMQRMRQWIHYGRRGGFRTGPRLAGRSKVIHVLFARDWRKTTTAAI